MRYIDIHKTSGFTIVELVIVITIIGLLSTMSFVGYSSVLKSARDTKRKVELGQIRVALELYKTAQDSPSYPMGNGKISPSLQSALAPYADTVPQDQTAGAYYLYTAFKNGADCLDESEACDDYLLAAHLEAGPTTSCAPIGTVCGSKSEHICNFCLTAKGKK